MDLGLKGKVAMVAAASKGIGLATAKRLADEGCLVSICARTEETLEAAVDEISGDPKSYIVDVSNRDDLEWWLEQTAADLGTPEILITNTGGPPASAFLDMTDEQWQSGIDSTLMNIVRLSKSVFPFMQQAGWGRIVHVTSFVAKQPSSMLPISSTLRAGINALTKVQARDFGPYGITVNAVLPGHTSTDRQTHLAELRAAESGKTVDEILQETASLVPSGQLADPDQIAAVVAFLASQPAGYVNGVGLVVDGGLIQGLP